MRRLFIAGNWKMHPIPDGALSNDSPYHSTDTVDVLVFPTVLHLKECIDAGLPTGAQAGHPEPHGAHTGDISMQMIKDIGCSHVLCGHSERRQYHGEMDEDVTLQAKAALDVGLHPIVCIGETAEERDSGKAQEIVEAQLKALPLDQDITLAYEPVWAIGTGNTATPDLAQEMHAFIRSKLPDTTKESMRILYGGSMKPENAEELLRQSDIDGGLIGGASLKPEQFGEIVAIAST